MGRGLWVWRCGGSQQGGLWRGGSRTHGKGEWVLMGFGVVSFIGFFFFWLRWWMWVCASDGWSVLLWQWLLVAVVAAMVDVPLLLLMLLMVMRGRR